MKKQGKQFERVGRRAWQESYDRGARSPKYGAGHTGLRAAVKWLSEGAKGKERIIDIGAGPGRITSELQNRNLHIVSLEPSQLEMDKHNVPHSKAAGVSDRLPFRTGSFDRGLMAYSLSYSRSMEETLQEAKRVIKKGGRLVVLLHNASSEYLSNLGQSLNYINDSISLIRKRHKENPLHGDEEKIRQLEENKSYLMTVMQRIIENFGSKEKTADYFRSHGFEVEAIADAIEPAENKGGWQFVQDSNVGYAILLKNI